jgi:hypothetical protein
MISSHVWADPANKTKPRVRVALEFQRDSSEGVADALSALAGSVEGLDEFPMGLIQRLIGSLQFSESFVEIATSECQNKSAARARKFQVYLKPTDSFLRLVAAARTGDWEGLLAEIERGHSVGSNKMG